MNPFNLENAISDWRKQLSQHQGLEPGYIEELELHLRDAIDDLIEQGRSQEDAFDYAVSEKLTNIEESAKELKSVRSSGFTPPKALSSWWIPALLPNILKITLRNFKRQPGYSFINISGLAIGMACCMIIFLYVQDELSYDRFHEKAERIYRVDQTGIWADFTGKMNAVGPAIAPILEAEIPEVENITRLHQVGEQFITIEDGANGLQYFEEGSVLAADSTFFDVFTLNFIEGNPTSALTQPNTYVITEDTRERYFQDQPALGKAIIVGNPGSQITYTVSGVVKNLPSNSHFDFDLLASMESVTRLKRSGSSLLWTTFVTYITINQNSSIEAVKEKLPEVLEKNAASTIASLSNMSLEEFKASGKSWELFLTPISDIRLKATEAGNRLGPISDMFYVYVFSTIALLIIALASINFMNLSSARSVHRAKEVGVRKTLGSFRINLIGQFLSESILFSFIALILALIVLQIVIEPFNQIAAKQLSISVFSGPIYAFGIGICTLFIGLIAGIYPALYLTSFNPIEAFKNKLPAAASGRLSFSGLRNFLVVFQFAISIMLISSSIIIYQQLEYTQNADLGFDKENVLIIGNVEKIGDKADTFKQVLEQQSGVVQIGVSNSIPPYVYNEDFGGAYGSAEAAIPINSMIVDADFISTLGMKMATGREFERDAAANASYVILNETAIKQINWGSEIPKKDGFPIGEYIAYSGPEPGYQIIGVVEDFNIHSLHSNIVPLAFFHQNVPNGSMYKGPNQFLSVRVNASNNLSSIIDNIEAQWDIFSAGLPFEYTFLDQELYTQYQAELRIGTVISIFTGLAIFIAILGLVGLISFSIERKTKEIGLRKVMGATSQSIVYLLSKEMTKLITISIFISIPAAWIMMNNWLQNFEYHIEISIFVFLISGVLALVLAWFSLSFQAIKAATTNPVNSLKSE